jgi:hypothetical protein
MAISNHQNHKGQQVQPTSNVLWCIKPRWAQSQVPLGQAPRGLDWATCASWHIAKSCLANEIKHTRRSSLPRRCLPLPSRHSPSPSRLHSERLGSKRPSNAQFIDRIKNHEDWDFAEYLDLSQGRPIYDQLKPQVTSTHSQWTKSF